MEITDILDCDEIPAGNLFAVFGFIAPSGESFREPGSNTPGFEDISFFEANGNPVPKLVEIVKAIPELQKPITTLLAAK